MNRCIDYGKSQKKGCSFSDALPHQRSPSRMTTTPSKFLDYCRPNLLKQRRSESAGCDEAWAFCLSGALHHWTFLAYDRMDLFFAQKDFSVEYLLSCFDLGPVAMCGCRTADLPAALRAISEKGVVGFLQFPFVSSALLDRETFTSAPESLYCIDRSHLGTCPPCSKSKPYRESFISASTDRGGFRGLASCLPCEAPLSPRYFPKEPFRISGADPADQQLQIKMELLRMGPLPACLSLDENAFQALERGGAEFQTRSPEQGVFYSPSVAAASLSSFQPVLVVGYTDWFWILRSSHGRGSFGYALLLEDGTSVDNLFNVSFQDSVSALDGRVLSCKEIGIQAASSGSPTPLSLSDPFLLPFPSRGAAADGLSAVSATVPTGPGSRARLRVVWALLFVLLGASFVLFSAFFFSSVP